MGSSFWGFEEAGAVPDIGTVSLGRIPKHMTTYHPMVILMVICF